MGYAGVGWSREHVVCGRLFCWFLDLTVLYVLLVHVLCRLRRIVPLEKRMFCCCAFVLLLSPLVDETRMMIKAERTAWSSCVPMPWPQRAKYVRTHDRAPTAAGLQILKLPFQSPQTEKTHPQDGGPVLAERRRDQFAEDSLKKKRLTPRYEPLAFGCRGAAVNQPVRFFNPDVMEVSVPLRPARTVAGCPQKPAPAPPRPVGTKSKKRPRAPPPELARPG